MGARKEPSSNRVVVGIDSWAPKKFKNTVSVPAADGASSPKVGGSPTGSSLSIAVTLITVAISIARMTHLSALKYNAFM
jgi:hypothetical protein